MSVNCKCQTCKSLFVATSQYVSSKYANDLCGFDNTSHACDIITPIVIHECKMPQPYATKYNQETYM